MERVLRGSCSPRRTRRRLHDFQSHARRTGSDHVELFRGGMRKIQHASLDEWTTIGDAHGDAFSIVEVGDLDDGLKRKRAMRRREFLHVVDLAGGGALSVIRNTVPTRDSGLGVAGMNRRRRGRRIRHGNSRGLASAAAGCERECGAQQQTRMEWASEHLKQFYTSTFDRWKSSAASRARSATCIFFLTFDPKHLIKGTQPRSREEWREF